MPDRFVLLAERLVILAILAEEFGAIVGRFAAQLDEELRQFQVVALARDAIELHQPQLDLRVPGRDFQLAGTESRY